MEWSGKDVAKYEKEMKGEKRGKKGEGEQKLVGDGNERNGVSDVEESVKKRESGKRMGSCGGGMRQAEREGPGRR